MSGKETYSPWTDHFPIAVRASCSLVFLPVWRPGGGFEWQVDGQTLDRTFPLRSFGFRIMFSMSEE